MRYFLTFLLTVGCIAVRSELIPADRLVPWTPGIYTGVRGGIPTDRTTIKNAVTLFGIDNTGVVNVFPALQTAANGLSSNDVLFLPAGTYNWGGQLSMKSFTTLRGAGTNNTILVYSQSGGAAIRCGTDTDASWVNPSSPSDQLVSGYTKGSSNLVLNSSSDSTWVGRLMLIGEMEPEPGIVLNTMGFKRNIRNPHVVTAQSGVNVTVWPPIIKTLSAGRSPIFKISTVTSSLGRGIGIEDFSINAAGSTSPTAHVLLTECIDSWVKNVRINQCKNYAFNIVNSAFCEMTECIANQSVDGPVSNHAGLLFATTTATLVYNNVLFNVFPDMEMNFGSAGNVIAYNLIIAGYFGGAMNANHGAHNHHNLWEGNVMYCWQSDGYFGSASDLTLFRNWISGEATGGGANETVPGIPLINANRFTMNTTVIGNIFGTTLSNRTLNGYIALGKPNIGNPSWNGSYGPPWTGTNKFFSATQSGTTITASSPVFSSTNVGWFVLDYTQNASGFALGNISSVINSTLATLTVSSSYASAHSISISKGPEGWQELDTNVAFTAIFKGNYYFPQGSPVQPGTVDPIANPVHPNSSLDGDTIPDSLYLTEQPAWWLPGLVWPPVRTNALPTLGLGRMRENFLIPAQAFLGSFIPPVGDTNPPPVVINGGTTLRGGVNIRIHQ